MSAAVGFLRAQIAEIEGDAALRWYGVALAFLHVVTYLYWVDQRVVAFGHAQAEANGCPLVRDSENVPVVSGAIRAVLIRAYLAAAISAGLLFVSARPATSAYAHLF